MCIKDAKRLTILFKTVYFLSERSYVTKTARLRAKHDRSMT